MGERDREAMRMLSEADRKATDDFERFLAVAGPPGPDNTIPEAWMPYATGTGPAPLKEAE